MGTITDRSKTDLSPERAWWFLGCLMVELTAPGPGGPVVSEATLPEGASPPLHVHADLDDSFYVLEGRLVVRCGDEVKIATAGSWVPFPRSVPHTFRVVDGPARTLQVHRHDQFLALVREVGEPAGELRLPAAGPGPSLEELDRAFAGHGIVNVGASMSEVEARGLLSGLGA